MNKFNLNYKNFFNEILWFLFNKDIKETAKYFIKQY